MSKWNCGSFLFRSKAELTPCSGLQGLRVELGRSFSSLHAHPFVKARSCPRVLPVPSGSTAGWPVGPVCARDLS